MGVHGCPCVDGPTDLATQVHGGPSTGPSKSWNVRSGGIKKPSYGFKARRLTNVLDVLRVLGVGWRLRQEQIKLISYLLQNRPALKNMDVKNLSLKKSNF